nr:pilus assembly protein CpaF [Rhodospirillales bacterium]
MFKDSISIHIIGNDLEKLTQYCASISALVNKEILSRRVNIDNPALMYKKDEFPDILILLLDESGISTLEYLSSLASNIRPPLIIIASGDGKQLMRLAMNAGARDFFSEPVSLDEIKYCLKQLFADCTQSRNIPKGVLTSIINAKGGSGASVLACNLAHMSSVTSSSSTVLIDMDLQFGTQSLLLNLQPKHTAATAMNDINELDSVAIEGYFAKHNSGLRLLSAINDDIVLPGEIAVENLTGLLELTLNNYDNVFIDLPRIIDPFSVSILSKSDYIMIVVQQTLAHMRDAKRLVSILKDELNIPDPNIIIVVNRFDSNSSLSLKDIKTALACNTLVKTSNDYERVSAAANLGIPLLDYAKNAPITLSMLDLLEHLDIEVHENYKNKSFLKKLLDL